MPSLFSRYFDVPGGPDLPGTTVPSVGGGGVTDHGELDGLADDDHSHYARTDGTRLFTGAILPHTMSIASAPNSSVFIDSSGGRLHFKDSAGASYDLTDTGGIGP